jgi:hypothetical protein
MSSAMATKERKEREERRNGSSYPLCGLCVPLRHRQSATARSMSRV